MECRESMAQSKFIAINTHIKKKDIKSITSHLKEIVREEQSKPTTSKRKEQRIKGNRINEIKRWFFENVNKIDKLLARLTMLKKERKFKLLILGMEEGSITTDLIDTKEF